MVAHTYIGTAGWNVPGPVAEHFSGEGSHLVRYARRMNCAEINSSFHRVHKLETYRKWAASVPDDFRFAVKMPRTVTHEGKLQADTQPMLESFLEQTSALGRKRGPILLQVPPKLEFDSVAAKDFFHMLRRLYRGPLAFEPRHPGWFGGEADTMLRHFKVARVAADPAVVPAAASPGGWREWVYFRLHGSPRRYYSAYGADHLERIAAEMRAATATAWCIFDNTASGAALGNALQLMYSLAEGVNR